MKAVQSVGTSVAIANRQHVVTQKIGIFIITAVKPDSMDYKKKIFFEILNSHDCEYRLCCDVTACILLKVYLCFMLCCSVSNYTGEGSAKVRKLGRLHFCQITHRYVPDIHFRIVIVASCSVTFTSYFTSLFRVLILIEVESSVSPRYSVDKL